MDDADRAQEQLEREDERRRLARPFGTDAIANGCCLNCDAPLAPALRFCDRSCMDDWARRLAAIRRNGAPSDD